MVAKGVGSRGGMDWEFSRADVTTYGTGKQQGPTIAYNVLYLQS